MHYTAVLDDGSVQCFGCRPDVKCETGHCNVPSDLRSAVSCSCSDGGCAAVRADGSVCWWGRNVTEFANGVIAEAGPCAAVAFGGGRALAVTRAGGLVRDCSEVKARIDPDVHFGRVTLEQWLASERGSIDLSGHRASTL
eukprot:TRINITY_DN12760_c1_g2_i1.p1 TRINITY_DN12760_c1_g2~~TRINITY_DN12760_c1_g2_i1.p1  ORF type:complete len:162 (+),score=16.85 TRINITY_DN12760_c1_g2_i1:67-486(+)